MPSKGRIMAHFSGYVQGVGFRFTTMALARHYPNITGCVRNMPDGRVELTAEGAVEDLDEFLGKIRLRMKAYIKEVELRRSEPTGEFSRFSISH